MTMKFAHRLGITGLIAGALVASGFTPAAAAELPLPGSGDPRDPYQIASVDDFVAVADAINESPGDFSSASYMLTADIDFAGTEFSGINTFSGVLDGAGHSISDIAYGTHPGDGHSGDLRGLIHTVTDGTVRNLTIEGARADNGDDTGFVAGIAVYGFNATFSGNSVIDAELVAANAEKVGGVVAQLEGGTITDNSVQGTIVANEMPAGIAAYANGATHIANNLVDVDITMVTGGGDTGTRGNNAAHIIAYPGNPTNATYTGNVALGGAIEYTGRIDGFVGRIAGYTGYSGWTADDNLASTEITIAGEPVSGPGTRNQHGADADPDQLAQQATYEALGWDFANAWRWDETLGHPVPNYSYTLFGDGSDENPFEITTAFDLEYLADQLNSGNGKYTGEKRFILTADLDFTDRAPFPGIDRFAGTMNGLGRTITGLTYAASTTGGAEANRLGFIRQLSDASVTDLTLRSVRADGGDNPDFVAGLAVIITDSTVEGVSIVDARLSATRAEKVAGIGAEIRGTSVIRTNWVDAVISADKMPAGITSYAADQVVLSENLVSAELTTRQTGGVRGVDAAHVVAYPGRSNSITVTSNVAHSGDIAYSGTIPGFAGRILGYSGPADYRVASLRDNLAYEGILIGGSTVSGAHNEPNGQGMTGEQLAQQATYEAIGWDFIDDWTFDQELGHPIPKFVVDHQRPNRITTTFHGDSQTQRGFSWYSSIDGGEPVVRISTDRRFPEGASTEDHSAERKTSSDDETFYQSVATGLEPGTTYYYRVGDRAAEVWSPTGRFVTSNGRDDFTFVNLTDTQSQNAAEAQLSAATMAKALGSVPDAEFVVHNGDVVENGEREQDWIDLLGAAQPSLLNTTLAPAAGNHEATASAFVDHFSLDAPNEQNTASGAYYSFDYNMAHFAVLNTNEDAEQAVSDAQLEWLRSDVTAARENGAEWIILSIHKGPYTTATHLDDPEIVAMRDVLVPLIDELDIDLVLQGHDHLMSRSKVLVSDPEGVENARAVDTTVITEVKNGKRAEYAVDPEGTIYFLPNTAGSKHYTQATSANGFDIEAYLQLFDRTGAQSAYNRPTDVQNFAGITVTQDRLTVDIYDIRNQSSPRVFDSFGIDRQISPAVAQIEALPDLDALTTGDSNAVNAARNTVDSLSTAQQGAVHNLDTLVALEQRLRELQGLVSTDGSAIAWADADATERQPITVRNDTRSEFTSTPVRITLTDTPDAAASSLAIVGADGVPLPHEIENWERGGTSVLWVKVPKLPAGAATVVWAYFGGNGSTTDPTRVWSDGYALVEHLAAELEPGDTRTDSTGTQTGTVVGDALNTVESVGGGIGADFGQSRIEYPGDVGGDFDRFTVSSIFTITDAELAALERNAPIVAKESMTADGQATFWQGVRTDNRVGTRLAGNSFEFGDIDNNRQFALPRPGTPHLLTQTYDGMTYTVFIDGVEVHSEFLEYRTTFSDPAVLTTIGDSYTNDGTLASPFPGVIDEVQIAGIPFTPEFEAFRFANYFGDAVTVGERADRGADPLQLIIGTPPAGTSLEAGLVEVTGTVSKRATIMARIAGDEIASETVDAGTFTIDVPVNRLGEQTITFTAESGSDSTTAEVALIVDDTVAPAQPEVTDDAADARGNDPEVTLTATPRTDDLEHVEATFFADDLITLDSSNTVVRSGTTAERVPDALTPDSGEVTGELFTTTVGENENPFQIYQISLTEQEAQQERFHLTWKGTGDARTVSGYVFDHVSGEWLLKDSGAETDGGEVSLDITARADENAVAGGELHILIWRGLTELPTGAGHDYEKLPDPATYDWAFDHVPDTQLYAQATPEHLVEQFEYVADVAEERKTKLAIQAGDLVNRPYLSQEYQYRNAEPAIRAWEDAGLPYMISWGNHDYHDVDQGRNTRLLLPKYYPMSRFEASLESSPFTFGGSHDIDNYFYTAELNGAKVLFLTVGYFSIDDGDEPGIGWARNVIETHSDHTVILAVHNSVNVGVGSWSNRHVVNNLVTPYSNVKLVLGGHVTGTGVTSATTAGGGTAYGVLTDYQGRVYGGQQYLKHISVDAENDLIYFNTYSPLLDTTTSDRHWHHEIAAGQVPGLYGHDTENFVLEVDLGGSTTRTLATSSLTVAAGDPTQIGPPQATIGSEPVSVVLEGVVPERHYGWFVELTDAAGHVTRSTLSTFSVTPAEVPDAPGGVVAAVAGDAITVEWSAPSDDGGAPIQQYEVALSNGTTATVSAGQLSNVFQNIAPGIYTASVRAMNSAGWSDASDQSNPVEVLDPGGPVEPGHDGTIVVTGDLTPGGSIVVTGRDFEPGATYELELRSTPVDLGSVPADADGGFVLEATIPPETVPGAHRVIVLHDGEAVASALVHIGADAGGGTDPGDTPGRDSDLSGHLSDTGVDGSLVAGMVALSVLLAVTGGWLLIRRRRGMAA